jgi:acyl homoserine lactone synthase/acyl-homoserine lactone synthase
MRMIGTGGGGTTEADALRAMFVARKEVFIDLLGWDVPMLAGQFELDHFDDPHARYLILIDEDGRHRASARLLPTTRPHILDSLYPFLCEDAVPRGPTTFEITRFCLDRHQTAAERREARNQLVSGLAITAIAGGISRYTGVAEQPWVDQVLDFGWQCRTLGPARQIGRQTLSALCIDIDGQTMDALGAAGIYDPTRSNGARQFGTAVAA